MLISFVHFFPNICCYHLLWSFISLWSKCVFLLFFYFFCFVNLNCVYNKTPSNIDTLLLVIRFRLKIKKLIPKYDEYILKKECSLGQRNIETKSSTFVYAYQYHVKYKIEVVFASQPMRCAIQSKKAAKEKRNPTYRIRRTHEQKNHITKWKK